jgi:hypothetical protein
MTWLADSTNNAGTPVSVLDCDTCRHVVTICPALPDDAARTRWGDHCLGDTCPSYRIERDVGIFFEPAFAAGLIRREPA